MPLLRRRHPGHRDGTACLARLPHTLLDTTSISGEDAAREVVSYLIDRGHTRIGMIAGQTATPPRESRIRGYRQALASTRVMEEVLIRGGDFTEAVATRPCANCSHWFPGQPPCSPPTT